MGRARGGTTSGSQDRRRASAGLTPASADSALEPSATVADIANELRADPFAATFGSGRGNGLGREPAPDEDGSGSAPDAILTVHNPYDGSPSAGRSFTFKVVRQGEDRYGTDRPRPHNDPRPLLQVYDHKHAGKPGFAELGQFVSSYYLSMIHDRNPEDALALHGGEPLWTVSVAAMSHVHAWISKHMACSPVPSS